MGTGGVGTGGVGTGGGGVLLYRGSVWPGSDRRCSRAEARRPEGPLVGSVNRITVTERIKAPFLV